MGNPIDLPDLKGAAIVCAEIANLGRPILYAERSDAVDEVDTGQ